MITRQTVFLLMYVNIFPPFFQEEKDESSKFEISVSDDFSGRWAFKSKTRGYFLGANADALVCTAKVPNDSELWFVHLAVRPQVNLHSIGRKRFAHLSDVQVKYITLMYMFVDRNRTKQKHLS